MLPIRFTLSSALTSEKKYVATVTSTGAAVGAAAAAPRIGSAVALALTVAESAAFHEVTALFTLAVAEVHGMPVHDVERRRMLLLAIVFGTGGPGLASSGKRIRRWLAARYVTKRWILAISKVLPFGIGAAASRPNPGWPPALRSPTSTWRP